jgi:hypothetical protein
MFGLGGLLAGSQLSWSPAQLISGAVHPSHAKKWHWDHSWWIDDLWELDYFTPNPYTQNFQGARQVFLMTARDLGITKNEQLFKLVEDRFVGAGGSVRTLTGVRRHRLSE